MAVPLTAFFSVFGFIFPYITKIRQGIQSLVHHKDHISSVATVTAVRTAVRHIEFPAERYMSVSAFSGTYKDFCSVCKHNALPGSVITASDKKGALCLHKAPSRIVLSNRMNRYLLLISSQSLKPNNSICQCEKCVVSATSNIESRMNLCSTLSV